MLDATVDEIEQAFSCAKNLNAASKNFLKQEGKSGEAVQSFAKEFRAVAVAKKPGALNGFIERNLPTKGPYLAALIRYAHPELINTTVEKIFDKHAEEFNKSYSKSESGVEITDKPKFEAVIKDVVAMIENALASSGLPETNKALKEVFLATVFEPDVLQKALPTVLNG